MDLLTLTQGRYVWLGLKASRKEEAIEQLLDRLLQQGAVPAPARDDLLEAILARERRLSTGLEHGVAIPHGTTTCIEHEVAGLGIFPEGVPFEAVDGDATRIVILLITPYLKRHRHVNNLAILARQLMLPDLRGSLLGAACPEDALGAIRRCTKGCPEG